MKNNKLVRCRLMDDVQIKVRELVVTSLLSCDQILKISTTKINALVKQITADSLGDLMALCAQDPASSNLNGFVIDGHQSFNAVLHYRVAHSFYNWEELDVTLRVKLAKTISETAKVKTGVEIHPAAKIGKNFVIDHGVGTIIGETCEIGDDCYILSGVILGAKRIANNPNGKRHPTIGNNTHIGSFARIFGAVTIGSNVFIAAHCVVTTDIPDNTKVLIMNQLQLVSTNNQIAVAF